MLILIFNVTMVPHLSSLQVRNGHTDIISLLLKADADPNFSPDNGVTPLYLASQNGHTDIISLLLKANADPNLQFNSCPTPLMVSEVVTLK